MMIRLLKSHVNCAGRKIPMGTVYRKRDKEARELIELNIAEEYKGPYPPKKMKTNLKNLHKCQQQES
jgi:hypothetical protein